MKVALGPLLGVESQQTYIVTVVVRREDANARLRLVLDPSVSDPIEEVDSVTLRRHVVHRFSVRVPIADEAQAIGYRIEVVGGSGETEPLESRHGERSWTFQVPPANQIPRTAFCSCNGSGHLHPEDVGKPRPLWKPGAAPVDYRLWARMVDHHGNRPFNYLLMAGDQVYADSMDEKVPILRDVLKRKMKFRRLRKWRRKPTQLTAAQQSDLQDQLEDFYEDLYITGWSDQNMAKMMASVPTVMMWDDHDIIDGWGSHIWDQQNFVASSASAMDVEDADLFAIIKPIATRYFEAFQIRSPTGRALIDSAATNGGPLAHYTMRLSLGGVELIVLDNRSQRTRSQVMGPGQWRDLEDALQQGNFFSGVDPDRRLLCFVVPVPLAHLNFAKAAESIATRWKHSSADDAIDHWDNDNHADQQKRLLDLIFETARQTNAKAVLVISGDVHTGGATAIENMSTGEEVTQVVSSPVAHKAPGRLEILGLRLATSDETRLAGYKLDFVQDFGSHKEVIIAERNYGYFQESLRVNLVIEGQYEPAIRRINYFK